MALLFVFFVKGPLIFRIFYGDFLIVYSPAPFVVGEKSQTSSTSLR